MKLVIVESPAKAKTIEKFLGPDYRVEASYGHIRDLPGSAKEIPAAVKKKSWARLAVDTEHGFRPVYVVPPSSKKRVQELKKVLAQADEVILATDEDREGESISWHLLEVLDPSVPVRRIAFHEITRTAIQEALASPRDVDHGLVKAQEARRILDRLYGYSLSPVSVEEGPDQAECRPRAERSPAADRGAGGREAEVQELRVLGRQGVLRILGG